VIRIQTLGGLSVRGDDGKSLPGSAGQPRRMSILALLARAGDRGISREKILALLWPDADEQGGRTLTQALYALRKDLGAEEAITGAKELRFDPALVSTDVGEFTSAVSRGDDARAASFYQGPFLDGFHLSGADEFARWVEKERTSLAHDHARVLESLARAALAKGEPEDSVAWWRKLAALDPLNARVTVGLMGALVAAGDRAGALRHAHVYEVLLEQELDLPPDREVMAVAAKLRQGDDGPPAVEATPPVSPVGAAAITARPAVSDVPNAASLSARTAVVEPPPGLDINTPAVEIPADSAGGRRPDTSLRAPRWAVGALVALAAGAGFFSIRGVLAGRVNRSAEATGVVVAVGRIISYGADSMTRAMAAPVADLLATSLARVPGLRVVSQGRMLELMQPAPGDTSAGALVSAARYAGATEVIDGALYTLPGGLLRLDLRRVDLATGAIRDVRTTEGKDLFALVDSGTAHLVAALGTGAPKGSIADVTTRSAVAYGLYVEGVRTLLQGDRVAAERLFGAALTADSTFAMAAWYHARVSLTRDSLVTRLARALRLSARATDRERLIIRAGSAFLVWAPELGTLAESLITRYPQETEGYLYAGVAKIEEGDFLAAIPPLRRAVEMDSLAFTRTVGAWGCNACAALTRMITAYELADSLAAAEREARRYARLQPGLPGPWIALWDVLERAGRFADAEQVARRIAALDGDVIAVADRAAYHAIRMGDFPDADRILRAGIHAGNAAARRSAQWGLIVSLRYQGRMAEAIETARVFRTSNGSEPARVQGAVSVDGRPLAVVLFEGGLYRQSAALFDSVALWREADEVESGAARDRAWGLTQAARALAAAGDTSRLAARADTIAAYGARSGSGRDQRLHSYVRGLLFMARNDLAGAERNFRAAMYSATAGYTAANVDLARVLIRLGRPRDAVAVLAPALRGKLDASNYYVTHTELYALLAQAWDSAGVPDSAATYYDKVARAWSAADPVFRTRADSARARTVALKR
jgi:DNA-binding SARP family transcriptional activator